MDLWGEIDSGSENDITLEMVEAGLTAFMARCDLELLARLDCAWIRHALRDSYTQMRRVQSAGRNSTMTAEQLEFLAGASTGIPRNPHTPV